MKRRFFGFYAAALAVTFAACSNSGTSSETNDSSTSTTTNTTESTVSTTTATSENSYAALADTVERNSQQGYYLNPRTGKAYKSLRVDRTTGQITDDAGEPVWRYVDRRNWWVYGDDDMNDTISRWGQVGEAKMEGEKLKYRGEGDTWSDYEARWSKDDDVMLKKYKVSDGGNKEKVVTENGDKVKIKTDEEGNTKIKVNDEKVKIDKNGNIKKD